MSRFFCYNGSSCCQILQSESETKIISALAVWYQGVKRNVKNKKTYYQQQNENLEDSV